MKTWRIYGIMTASKYLGEVEAETEEEAIEKGEELDCFVNLCHQCSGEVEISDLNKIDAEEIESDEEDEGD